MGRSKVSWLDLDNIILKPCPFCGGPAEIKQYKIAGISIRCRRCTITKKQRVIRKSVEWLKDEMVKDWNTRVFPPAIHSKGH